MLEAINLVRLNSDVFCLVEVRSMKTQLHPYQEHSMLSYFSSAPSFHYVIPFPSTAIYMTADLSV